MRDERFNKKLVLWFYYRMRFCVGYEVVERSLVAVRVSPRGTSTACPKCDSRLASDGYRTLKCSSSGFIGDRDVVATINLRIQLVKLLSIYPKMWGLWGGPKAPNPVEDEEEHI